jgi:hypothetical protein
VATAQLYAWRPLACGQPYDGTVPRSWQISLVILVVCLIASMVIGTVKLIQM